MAQGSVPAAVVGTITPTNKGEVTQGVFDATNCAQKRYTTVLTLVNVPVPVTKGSNAGFGGLEIYDFAKGLILFEGANAALTASLLDTNITDGTNNYYFALGTATATDVAEGSASTGENNLIPYVNVGTSTPPDTLDGRSGNLSSSLGAPQLLDGTGTAKKVFLNINVKAADISATSLGLNINGSIQLTYTDMGAAL